MGRSSHNRRGQVRVESHPVSEEETEVEEAESAEDPRVEEPPEPTPPVDLEAVRANNRMRYAIWRARLHYENLVKEFQEMLNDREFCGHLRQAALAEQVMLPGNAEDWKLFKKLEGVLDRVPLPPEEPGR